MAEPPMMDITRFRMNSHSSIDNYDYTANEEKAQGSGQKDSKEIPLILKKMNSVEKYVSEFKVTEMLQKQYRPKRQQSPLYDPSLSQSKHLEKILSRTPQVKLNQRELKDLEQKCYVKYSSTSAHDSDSKMNAIQNAQHQYVKLKHSIHTIGVTQQNNTKAIPHTRTEHVQSVHHKKTGSLDPGYISFVNSKSIYLLNKKKMKQKQSDFQSNRINHKDIEKELKTSVIEEGGKKYFADLYLMKRERDKMLKEIFGASDKSKSVNLPMSQQAPVADPAQNLIQRKSSYQSKFAGSSIQRSAKSINQQSSSTKQSKKKFPKLKVNMTQMPNSSYQQKMHSEEQSFVQQKILKDRSEKKEKMLKGRNMNWNVYYEMLALKKNEKDKLKGYCKFSQTYGED